MVMQPLRSLQPKQDGETCPFSVCRALQARLPSTASSPTRSDPFSPPNPCARKGQTCKRTATEAGSGFQQSLKHGERAHFSGETKHLFGPEQPWAGMAPTHQIRTKPCSKKQPPPRACVRQIGHVHFHLLWAWLRTGFSTASTKRSQTGCGLRSCGATPRLFLFLKDSLQATAAQKLWLPEEP